MRRVGVLFLVAVLAVFLASPASASREVSLRVLSYNIHTGIGSDGALDLARTADAIRDTRADVVALQEVDVHWDARSDFRDQAADLARPLRMRVFFAPIYDLDPLTAGRAAPPVRRRDPEPASRCCTRTNHWITRLSTQDENPVPTPAPGFAEAVVLVRGVAVHVYSTHLDYRADPAVRATQVADMLRIMADAARRCCSATSTRRQTRRSWLHCGRC